jgi:ribosomal protein S18 acetylase RimI-like enzyme
MNSATSAAFAVDTDFPDDGLAGPGHPPALTRVPALLPIATTDRRLEYCLTLARDNMSPYLIRRGQAFDETRWRNLAPRASFYLIAGAAAEPPLPLGFLSMRYEPDCPVALHIGDIQLEARHRNRGIGWATLLLVEDLARRSQKTELTLNVFRDNPAQRLYERFGFRRIDMQFDKYKMRKTLPR